VSGLSSRRRDAAMQLASVVLSSAARRFSCVTDISGTLEFLKRGGHDEVEQVGHLYPMPLRKGRQLAEVCLGNPGLSVSSLTHHFACSL
jgi:hypothetical protein